MITALTGPIASNPEVKDALLAAVAAFNKRGGVGTTHAKLQADVCDTRGDANGEVACARQMVDDGVVATLNDLTYNNPAGVVDVLEGAGIPRIGIGGTDISEFSSSVSYPVSAGIIAAYLGTAVGFKQDGNTKICLVRTDAPTGATFKGFLTPMFTAIGVDISCDVAVATGATDYAPYVAQVQQENPDAVLISHSDSVTTQLIGAMAQLNAKIPLGRSPGIVHARHPAEVQGHHEGHGPRGFVPVPGAGERQELPRAQAVLRRHEGVGQERASSAAKLKAAYFAPWISTLAFVNVTKGLDSFTPATVIGALQEREGRRSPGAGPAVDAVDARLQRVQVELEPLRVHLSVQRQGRRHRQDTDRRHPVHQVTAG